MDWLADSCGLPHKFYNAPPSDAIRIPAAKVAQNVATAVATGQFIVTPQSCVTSDSGDKSDARLPSSCDCIVALCHCYTSSELGSSSSSSSSSSSLRDGKNNKDGNLPRVLQTLRLTRSSSSDTDETQSFMGNEEESRGLSKSSTSRSSRSFERSCGSYSSCSSIGSSSSSCCIDEVPSPLVADADTYCAVQGSTAATASAPPPAAAGGAASAPAAGPASGAAPTAGAGGAPKGGGVMQSTTSEAVLVAMLAARCRVLKGQPPEATLKLVAYASDQVRVTITMGLWSFILLISERFLLAGSQGLQLA